MATTLSGSSLHGKLSSMLARTFHGCYIHSNEGASMMMNMSTMSSQFCRKPETMGYWYLSILIKMWYDYSF
jgi:hypothetical protein